MTRQADIQVQDHGSIVLLVPLSAAGEAWVNERIGPDNGYQPHWPTVLCEPRYVWGIVDVMRAAGLVVSYQREDSHAHP